MTATAEPILDGILRVTLPLPSRPGHVHTYLLEGEDGWTLVDTGLGLPGAKERWAEELAGLEVRRVVITHMHPDHVGAAADVRELTGAEVLEGELDYRQCLLVWGSADWPNRIAEWFLANGVPSAVANELLEVGFLYGAFIRYAEEPTRAAAGRARRRLGGGADARPRRRAALPVQGRRPDRRRPSPHPDLARGRALSGEPPRPDSATTSTRSSARSPSTRGWRSAATAR